MYKISYRILITSFFCHFSFEKGNLGKVSKVYRVKTLLLGTWEILANIVERENETCSSCNIHKTNKFLNLAKMAE